MNDQASLAVMGPNDFKGLTEKLLFWTSVQPSMLM